MAPITRESSRSRALRQSQARFRDLWTAGGPTARRHPPKKWIKGVQSFPRLGPGSRRVPGKANLVQLEPYPRILINTHMLCAVCLPVDPSNSIRNHPQNNKTKPTRSDARGAAQPHTRTLPVLFGHIRTSYRPYDVVGCHKGRRAWSLLQKRGGSTSSKGSAFTAGGKVPWRYAESGAPRAVGCYPPHSPRPGRGVRRGGCSPRS